MAPPQQDLAQLLGKSASGDRAAFARLYEASAAKLFGVALRIVRREDWAEEVLQECYVSIWTHAPDYRPGLAAPMTWMTRRAQPGERPSGPTSPARTSISQWK